MSNLEEILESCNNVGFEKPNQDAIINAKLINNELELLKEQVTPAITLSYLGGILFTFYAKDNKEANIDCLNDGKILLFCFKFGCGVRSWEVEKPELNESIKKIMIFLLTEDLSLL